MEGVGIGLVAQDPVGAGNGELVGVIGPPAGQEALPDAAGDLLHGIGFQIPEIEITHYGDSSRPRRPDPEHIAVNSVAGGSVGTHILVGADRCSLVEEVGI